MITRLLAVYKSAESEKKKEKKRERVRANGDDPLALKNIGHGKASGDYYDFFPERQLNLLVYEIVYNRIKTNVEQMLVYMNHIMMAHLRDGEKRWRFASCLFASFDGYYIYWSRKTIPVLAPKA